MDLDAWKDKRDKILRTMDVQSVVRDQGCKEEEALIALHKARYECVDMESALREESREWLQSRGYKRLYGLPWPDK